MPPVTRFLLIATIAVYLLQQVAGDWLTAYFALWPLGGSRAVSTGRDILEVGFQPWQVVTYAFLHGNFPHLALNGFALYMFGGSIEAALGSRAFVTYWFVCVIGAAVAQLAVVGPIAGTEGFVPTVGASGGVYGLLLAFGMFFPKRIVMLLIPPIPMPAWLFVTVFAVIELYLGMSNSQSPVAHFAHLGGMVAGLIMILYWRGNLPLKPRRRLTL